VEVLEIILAVVVVMLATTVPCGVTLAQTEPNQKAGEIPPDLLAAIQNDLKDDLEETKSCLEREGLSWNESLRAGVARETAANASATGTKFFAERALSTWLFLRYHQPPIPRLVARMASEDGSGTGSGAF
jgi:hypothetical protein